MNFGMFFLISKSQDVKILGIKRTGFPILSQQKMKEHDDMLKDINLYHLNLEFIVIFWK